MTRFEVWLFAKGKPLASSGKLSHMQSENALGFALDRIALLQREKTPALVAVIRWEGIRATEARFHRNGLLIPDSLTKTLTRRLARIGLSGNGIPLEELSELPKKKKLPRPKTVTAALDAIRNRKPIQKCEEGFARDFELHVTIGVSKHVSQRTVRGALQRFLSCDWGEVNRSVAKANNRITREKKSHQRIFGVYQAPDETEFWIVSDPARRTVVAVLPHEYPY